jgi:RND family efflux transporter MFP subunit
MEMTTCRPLVDKIAALAAIALLAFGLASGCAPSGGNSSAEEGSAEVPRNVRVLTLAESELEQYLTISGPTRPLRGTDLSAEEGGRVIGIPHEKGAPVRAGDELVVLDRRLLAAEMNAAQANVELQTYNAESLRQLLEANSASEIELRQAETTRRGAAAQAEVAAIRYERAAITAPYDGIVADRYVELGQLVAPGTPVARIADPSRLILDGAVSEREVHVLADGTPAKVLFDGVDGTAAGTVAWVGFEAHPTTGKFKVEIQIDNPRHSLRPGVIARARILTGTLEDVITIPRDAIVQRSTGPVAYVVQDGVAEERALRLGPDQGLMVVVEEGLASGEHLVVRGQREIHQGSAVVVREEATAADGTVAGDPQVVSQSNTVAERWNATSGSEGTN